MFQIKHLIIEIYHIYINNSITSEKYRNCNVARITADCFLSFLHLRRKREEALTLLTIMLTTSRSL